MSARRVAGLNVALGALSVGLIQACSLDFEQFAESTQVEDVRFLSDEGVEDQGPLQDLGMRDAGDDSAADAATIDRDRDGVADAQDNCPDVPNPNQDNADNDEFGDLCDDDRDGDTYLNDADNCPDLANDQVNLDGDELGDLCDDDVDGDGLDEAAELSRGTDPRLADTDGDGNLDGDDSCPLAPERNAADSDGDTFGDGCDSDDDADGVLDWADACPFEANQPADACADDFDGDGINNDQDTCPNHPNDDQAVEPCKSRFTSVTYARDVQSLALTGPDSVLAGTSGGGLLVEGDSVRLLTNAAGLASNQVFDVATDAQGRMFFATKGGLTVLRPNGYATTVRYGDQGGGPRGTLTAVAVAGETIWVGGPEELGYLTGAQWTSVPQIAESGVVNDLYVDPMGRTWIAGDAAVLRTDGAGPAVALAGLPDLGGYVGVGPGRDDGAWILGRTGMVLLSADGLPVDAMVFSGFEARGVVLGDDGRTYVATDNGLRRIEVDGNLYPPALKQLPTTDVRAVAGEPSGLRWVATAGGLVALDGYFANFDAQAGLADACVLTAARVGDRLWVGTNDGLRIYGPSNTFTTLPENALPSPRVTVIRQIGEEVWVGTALGVGVLAVDGSSIRQHDIRDVPAAEVTDIVEGANGQVWVATHNGLARYMGAGNPWLRYTTDSVGQNFPNNDIRGLAHNGAKLWAATLGGVAVFTESLNSFEIPLTTRNAVLPDLRTYGVVAHEGQLFIATGQGVAWQNAVGGWSTLRMATNGLPEAIATDFVRSVFHDGEYLWMLMGTSQPFPSGSLVRRAEDGTLTIFSKATTDFPAGASNGGRLDGLPGQELLLSTCGSEDTPGGLAVLDGSEVVARDLSGLGLPGNQDSDASLTYDPQGRPMFTLTLGERPWAGAIDPDRSVRPLSLPVQVDHTPVRCALPANGETDLWCVLGKWAAGHRITDAQWSILGQSQVTGSPDFRDVAPESNSKAWVATSIGIIILDNTQASFRILNQVSTSGGLPSNDVRVILATGNGQVVAGTSSGLGILNTASSTWTTLTNQLPSLEVLSIAAQGAVVWVGTTNGLARVGVDGTVTVFGLAQGLPALRVDALAVHPDGRVLVGTPAGLAIGDGVAPFVNYGFADGLPGIGVQRIVIARDGTVWVQSDDGIAAVNP